MTLLLPRWGDDFEDWDKKPAVQEKKVLLQNLDDFDGLAPPPEPKQDEEPGVCAPPRLGLGLPYPRPLFLLHLLTSTSMLVFVACDLPVSSHASLFPPVSIRISLEHVCLCECVCECVCVCVCLSGAAPVWLTSARLSLPAPASLLTSF